LKINILGIRTKASTVDLSEEVPDDVESDIKEAAEISMGTEITEQDEQFIFGLAD
jgi:nucleolar protein 58